MTGYLSRARCAGCGRRLWRLSWSVADTSPALSALYCGSCDR